MGAQQSSDGAGRAPTTVTAQKTCYYELLGVERLATEEELKKAYRRKALELHPDRNINNVAIATQKFAEVQAAYDILSDPQERAWYDSHRDAILSGDDGYGDGADGPATAFHNVRLTTTAEILNLMRRFDSTVPFNDEPTGFFGIARETFEHLGMEEQAAADFDGTDCPDYPTFGSSDDEYDPTVKLFYSSWVAFSSRKSFSWKDKYRLSEAPDRRVRRLMEKENKKLRDDALREFNDAVRFLVKFVRKRDPRYLPNTQTEAERQKAMRDAAAAQATRSRVANQEKIAAFQLPEWASSRDGNINADGNADGSGAGTAASEGEFSESEESEEVEVLECVVCNKVFKSDKQLEAHEKSKKHIKAVRQLRHQMRKEGAELDLDSDEGSGPQRPTAQDGLSGVTKEEYLRDSTLEDDTEQLPLQQSDTKPGNDNQLSPTEPTQEEEEDDSPLPEASPPSDDEYASREAVVSRLAEGHKSTTEPTESLLDDPEEELSEAMGQASVKDASLEKKLGKAKAKRAKKAAAADAASATDMHKCSVCAESFPSRTKLFRHVHDEGHAAAVPASNVGGGKPRKGKQKRQ